VLAPVPAPQQTWNHPLLALSPLRSVDQRRPLGDRSLRAPLLGLGPLRRVRPWVASHPEVTSLGLPARSVSHRLVPCTPPGALPALFHAGGAPGVAPFRAFPSCAAVRLSTPIAILSLFSASWFLRCLVCSCVAPSLLAGLALGCRLRLAAHARLRLVTPWWVRPWCTARGPPPKR